MFYLPNIYKHFAFVHIMLCVYVKVYIYIYIYVHGDVGFCGLQATAQHVVHLCLDRDVSTWRYTTATSNNNNMYMDIYTNMYSYIER